MIVWLASYPRSGNTLLRQIFKQCLGLDSYVRMGGAPPEKYRILGAQSYALCGTRYAIEDRTTFLAQARCDAAPILIKTHELPSDAERAIYVVRDGRLALQSFVRFQETYESCANAFLPLLLGAHVYRDWTTHVRTWRNRRTGPLFVVRFEELVQASPELLQRLADFVELRGPIRPWHNPQKRLQQMEPAFFGKGTRRWVPDEFWTLTRQRQFFTLHGPLLQDLGYADEAEVAQLAYPGGSDDEHLLRQARQCVDAFWQLDQVCAERATLIEQLQRTCNERLELIQHLQQRLDERLANSGSPLFTRFRRFLESALRACWSGVRGRRKAALAPTEPIGSTHASS